MPEQLTRQQELDAKYNSEEQVRARQAKAHDDLIGASIPKAFDLPSSTPIGSEFGLGTKYDVGISKDQLDDRAEYNAQNQTTGDKWKNATIKMGGTAGATFIAGTLGTTHALHLLHQLLNLQYLKQFLVYQQLVEKMESMSSLTSGTTLLITLLLLGLNHSKIFNNTLTFKLEKSREWVLERKWVQLISGQMEY